MEHYFYILVVFALFLKLGLYFCWYHMRRRAALAREVHVVMPDGTTRRAVVTGRGGCRSRREDRQILAQADTLQHSENQGFEERPVYPHVMTGNAPVGGLPDPPPYAGLINGMGSTNEWKLPKYEDLPPPYTNSSTTETGCSASEEVAVVPASGAPPPPVAGALSAVSVPLSPATVQHSPPASSVLPPPEYTSSSAPPGTDDQQQHRSQAPQQRSQAPQQHASVSRTTTTEMAAEESGRC